MSVSVTDIAERIASGQSLLDGDTAALGSSPDLVSLGVMADTVRQRLRGDRVTYVRVLEIEDDGFTRLGAAPETAGEIRLVVVPDSVDQAVARWRRVTEWAGSAERVTAYDLADLVSRDASLRSWRPLVEAGAVQLSGVTLDRLVDPVGAVQAAASMGFGMTRLSVAKGSGDDLVRWARVANEIGALGIGVQTFAPLPTVIRAGEPTTGYEDSKLVALARLVCEHVPSIQVDWRAYGPKLAQVALFFGADDFDRVSTDDASPLGPRRSPMEELRRNIDAASRRGFARNARFEVLG